MEILEAILGFIQNLEPIVELGKVVCHFIFDVHKLISLCTSYLSNKKGVKKIYNRHFIKKVYIIFEVNIYNMKVGYARVSTRRQKLERQINEFKRIGIIDNLIFTDKYTGKTLERQGLDQLLSVVRAGDTIVVTEIDRLGRNRQETKELILHLLCQGVDIECLEMPYLQSVVFDVLKKDNSYFEILANTILDVILEVAEEERLRILKRTMKGRELAKAKGVQFGRRRKLNLSEFKPYFDLYMCRKISCKEIQEKLSISRQLTYKYIYELKNENK